VLYANDLAEALFSDIFPDPVRPANLAHYVFLSPPAWTFRDWEKAASDTVAVLRAEAGRKPYDRGLSDLVGQLSTRSEEFRVRLAAHDVGFHRAATKQLHHPLVGDLTLAFEMLEVPVDPGLSVLTYSAEPGSQSEEASRDLERWSETQTKLSAARAVCRRQQLWRAPRRILQHPRSRSARSGCWLWGRPGFDQLAGLQRCGRRRPRDSRPHWAFSSGKEGWSRHADSNCGPAVYEVDRSERCGTSVERRA